MYKKGAESNNVLKKIVSRKICEIMEQNVIEAKML